MNEPDQSGLSPAIEVLTKGYDLFSEQIKSLQNRCGVGLGVMVAASPSGVFRFFRIMPTFLDQGWVWVYVLGSLGILLFGAATYFFLRGFFIDRLYLPFEKNELLGYVWEQGENEVQLYRLSFLNAALEGLDEAATEKRNQLRNGIFSVIFGVLVFLIIELLRYTVVLKEGEWNGQTN